MSFKIQILMATSWHNECEPDWVYSDHVGEIWAAAADLCMLALCACLASQGRRRGPLLANAAALALAAVCSLNYHVTLSSTALVWDILTVTVVVFVFTLSTRLVVLGITSGLLATIVVWIELSWLGLGAQQCPGTYQGFPTTFCHFLRGELVVIGGALPFGALALWQVRAATTRLPLPTTCRSDLSMLLRRASLLASLAALCLLGDRIPHALVQSVCAVLRFHACWHVLIGLAAYHRMFSLL
jgi:hypothetical protein